MMKPEEALALQTFQLLAELYYKIQDERRELTVPGVAKAAETENVLFSQEDVKATKQEAQVQKIGMEGYFTPLQGNPFRFRLTGQPAHRFFGGKGRSFGPGPGRWIGKGGKARGKGWISQKSTYRGKGGQGVLESGHDGIFGPWRPSKSPSSGAPISTAEKPFSLVGEVCPSTGEGFDYAGRGARFLLPPLGDQAREKDTLGGGAGTESHAGLCGRRGGTGSLLGGHKVLGALVCRQKDGPLGGGKTQIDFGLSGFKQAVEYNSLQTRPLERYLSFLKERYVCHQGGPQRCVFSLTTFRQFKTFCEDAIWQQNFSDGRGVFWTQRPATIVDETHVGLLEKMAEPRFVGVCIPGRHTTSGQVTKVDGKTP